MITSFGCPKLLFLPTPIKAICGLTTLKNSSVVEVFEPWWATFKIVEFKIFKLYLYKSKIFLSATSSISPVNSIEKFL